MARHVWASASSGERVASAARAQVGVTTGYDPAWIAISYPNGDVARSTGVCADVVIRAARDGLGLDLQKLVHEDMTAHFDVYPARRTWRSRRPDSNIDHRRVLNLETFFQRTGSCLWHASGPVAGDAFPRPLQAGDIVTWLLDARLPHIGIVVGTSRSGSSADNPKCQIVHNIGRGAEQSMLAEFHPHRAAGHYRWPTSS
ncbi:DUF1287 domain-containing protein [Occallatibacter savannae]|uniref:DUF1287 domain-containing protein n=1 Tax=Occallatibacter savannae TaxID=1002691 RepID=UPI0019524C11|nr:DUF1287 domain-containing protein [Occallatibacter savannae]